MNSSLHIRVFQSQDILNPDGEPLCITAASEENGGIFWIALQQGIVRAYSTTQNHASNSSSTPTSDRSSNGTSSSNTHLFHKLFEMKTISKQIESIHYLPELQKLITLESEQNKRFCRIYDFYSANYKKGFLKFFPPNILSNIYYFHQIIKQLSKFTPFQLKMNNL